MINKKELFIILITIIVITLSINLSLTVVDEWINIFYTFLAVSLVILLNVFAKKIAAYNLDSEIEMKTWDVELELPFSDKKIQFPMGTVLPVISKIILFPINSLVWMACLVFDVKPRIYRGAKRYGLYTFSDVTEYHIGLIAASGIIISLISAVAGYFLGFPLFARLSIYYAFFNMLPILDLDGNKIFFGSIILWSLLASFVLLGMFFAIFMI